MEYETLTAHDQLSLATSQLRNYENQHYMTVLTLEAEKAATGASDLVDHLSKDIAEMEAKIKKLREMAKDAAKKAKAADDGS